MSVQIIDKDKAYKKLTKELTDLGKLEAAIGLFGEGSTPETNIAERGKVHEFGSTLRKIPKRSFLRTAFDENRTQNLIFTDFLFTKLLNNIITTKTMISLLSEKIIKDIKRKIAYGSFTPLSPITIKKKKSSKPLIDTGQMWNSIESRIRKKTKNE